MFVFARTLAAAFALAVGLACPLAFAQEGPGDPTIASEEDGKYFDADGDPTYKFASDGTVDWYTYSGYRRYHSECHVCHGPDGLGSSYAPAISDSMKRLSYYQFLEVVASGKQDVDQAQQKVMPAFGANLNVMCYVDDIYIYLRARAQGNIPRGRPPKHEPKPESFTEAEDACMGG
jgi:methanol metabolism-related c-type cytochrome